MKQLIIFTKKEFLHILRDNRTLMVILGMPVLQILLLGFAINTEVRDIRVAVCAPSPDYFSRGVTDRIRHNPYFRFQNSYSSLKEAEGAMRRGKLDLVIVFQVNPDKMLKRNHKTAIQLITDSSDPNRGAIAAAYASSIINRFQMEQSNIDIVPYQITTESRMIYNPQMRSAFMFVPGIMGLVLMIISTIMTSVSIVREKEQGTMEMLLVSPLRQSSMIVAKVIPYLLISFMNLFPILLISYYALQVPMNGSLGLLLFVSIIYIFLSLSFGLIISSIVDKQFNAVIISAITVTIPTLMLSGMIFPISNMPDVIQLLSHIVPARWFISAIRKVMIQGLGIMMIWKELGILFIMTLFFLGVSILKTQKRLK